ncbi:biotin--[acetyl-CoA-carboxylase] ligase [Thalassoroseus pseudoceratinae]|uniref:biotin--[acetyl-CoA-carboxylase] ligase n=1 Tax=Thalassoroseus pseudoceratinae TaxID=2713176 RepID=UPI0014242FEE|nr:biotin--[acetyl-CoA-carboxylase] ligase [Thalassoroseus pseudoceratinae]
MPASKRFSSLDPLTVGTLLGVLAALAYTGANTSLRFLARENSMDWAFWVTTWKSVPAALVAWVIIGYRMSQGLVALPPRKTWGVLIAGGLMMQIGGNVMFQWALSYIGLALTVPMTFSTILLSSAILGRIFLNEPVNKQTLIAIGLLILAICSLSAGSGESARSVLETVSVTEVLLAIGAAIIAGTAYGSGGVLIKRHLTSELPLAATLVFFNTTGVVVLGVLSAVRLGPAELMKTAPLDLTAMLTAGVFNAIAFFSLGAALRRIPVVRANLINASQAALCSFAGVMFFHEAVTIWLLIGFALTIAGLIIMGRKTRVRTQAVDNTESASDTPPSMTDPSQFRSELLENTFLEFIEIHQELPSTNDRALELASEDDLQLPALVLAHRQSAGRGRGANRWWADKGTLTFSLIIDAHHFHVPPERWTKISLVVGMAICKATHEFLHPKRPSLKWPNDVLIDGRKLCGILIEMPSAGSGRVVIGIGLNVNTNFETAPEDIRSRATSLRDETGLDHNLNEVLLMVLRALETELTGLANDVDLPSRWDRWCWLTGRTVEVENGQPATHGLCRGIDADGALLIDTNTGTKRVYSGVVRSIS